MVSIILAAALAGVATVAVIRLPFLHPLQLWSVPWALSTSLYALHLLPYRPLSTTAAMLIAGCTACFTLGVGIATRRATRAPTRRRRRSPTRYTQRSIEMAASLAVAVTIAGLTLYLGTLSAEYGLRDALVTSYDVRLALAVGTASLTIKYLYVAYAAAALCGLAAAQADGLRRRRLWLCLGTVVVLSQYFTTGRANIVLAALVMAVAEAVARQRQLSARALLSGSAALVAFVLVIFTAGGAIIGKTLDNNPLGEVASPLTEHRLLRPFALPYQYASAPIPAFDRQATVAASTEDALGCATFSVVCRIGARLGLNTTAEAPIRPFTSSPLPWNTYTAIDLPLIDGGPLFAAVFFSLIGWLAGSLWRAAREGGSLAILLYAVYASVLLYSAIQNNFFAPHVVGACVLAALLLWSGRLLSGWRTLAPRPRLIRARFVNDAQPANNSG